MVIDVHGSCSLRSERGWGGLKTTSICFFGEGNTPLLLVWKSKILRVCRVGPIKVIKSICGLLSPITSTVTLGDASGVVRSPDPLCWPLVVSFSQGSKVERVGRWRPRTDIRSGSFRVCRHFRPFPSTTVGRAVSWVSVGETLGSRRKFICCVQSVFSPSSSNSFSMPGLSDNRP